MIENLLQGNAWFALAVGVISYAIGYYLAIYEAYLYHAGANNYIVFEGIYELSPDLQKNITWHHVLNVKLLATLLVLSIAILVVWEVCVQDYDHRDLFLFLMGGLVLVHAAASMRRLRNIVLFHHAISAKGLSGKIEYSKRTVHTLSFVELFGFAVLYLLMFLVSGSWFFLGGALVCLVAGNRHRDWTKVYT